MLNMKFIGMKAFLGTMQRMKKAVPHASLASMKQATQYLRGYIVKNKLRGQVLKTKSGRLAGSIDREEFLIGGGAVGRVGSNLKYARIHEMGGVIKASSAPYLKFFVDGHWVMTDQVKIPARPYIWSSFLESTTKLGDILGKKFIVDVVAQGTRLMGSGR